MIDPKKVYVPAMLRNIFLAIVWLYKKRYFCGCQM